MQRLAQLLSVGYLLLAALISVVTVARGPLGAAPFPVGPARTPIVVTVAYGTEKQAWLDAAVARFEAADLRLRGRPVEIELIGMGSQEIVTEVLDGTRQPTVISPASSIQLELLRSAWQTRFGTSIFLDGADTPQPLVITPLVVVMWQARALALWPNGPDDAFWGELHDALADPQGWATHGHPEWGFVKFGHTSPHTSNSGLQTLLLLAYAYHAKAQNLTTADLLDPAFQTWLREIEQSVLAFGDSTGTFMEDMVRFGPSKYDAVAVYENVALQHMQSAQTRWNQPIRIYYPPATILSDHPYAILNAPWVDADQRAAARLFRDFLLSEPTQALALEYGFRPANAQVAVVSTDPNNPFTKYRSYGVQVEIAQQVAVPPGEVLTTLTELWRRIVNR